MTWRVSHHVTKLTNLPQVKLIKTNSTKLDYGLITSNSCIDATKLIHL